MFLLVQRTDTLPEMRAMINTDHVVALMPGGATGSGGAKTKLYLANGDTWEIALPFTRAASLFREETEAGA